MNNHLYELDTHDIESIQSIDDEEALNEKTCFTFFLYRLFCYVPCGKGSWTRMFL